MATVEERLTALETAVFGPTTTTGFYGSVSMDGLGNTQIGGPNGSPQRQVAQKFRAKATTLTGVRITLPNFNLNYCGGTGGSLNVSIQTDLNGFPSGVAIAQTSITNLKGTPNNPP